MGRTEASYAVTEELKQLGFPVDFAVIIGQQLNSDFTATWMLRYLKAAHPTSMEEVADEMLEILEFRERFIQRKISQQGPPII